MGCLGVNLQSSLAVVAGLLCGDPINEMLPAFRPERTSTSTSDVSSIPLGTYKMCFFGHKIHLSMLSPSGCGWSLFAIASEYLQ